MRMENTKFILDPVHGHDRDRNIDKARALHLNEIVQTRIQFMRARISYRKNIRNTKRNSSRQSKTECYNKNETGKKRIEFPCNRTAAFINSSSAQGSFLYLSENSGTCFFNKTNNCKKHIKNLINQPYFIDVIDNLKKIF